MNYSQAQPQEAPATQLASLRIQHRWGFQWQLGWQGTQGTQTVRGTQRVRGTLGAGAQGGREGVEHGLPGNLRKKGIWEGLERSPARQQVLSILHPPPAPLCLPTAPSGRHLHCFLYLTSLSSPMWAQRLLNWSPNPTLTPPNHPSILSFLARVIF